MRIAECKMTKKQSKNSFHYSTIPVFHYSPILYFVPLNSQVLIYRSPVSGRITTIIFPSLSCLLATSMAAHTAAPEEIPVKIPSSLANLL